jgi:hypothetical protein
MYLAGCRWGRNHYCDLLVGAMAAGPDPQGIVEARFAEGGSLGLVLSDARREMAAGASTSIVRLRQVIPGTQAAAMTVRIHPTFYVVDLRVCEYAGWLPLIACSSCRVQALRPGLLLLAVDSKPVEGVPYERVLEMLTARPLVLTFGPDPLEQEQQHGGVDALAAALDAGVGGGHATHDDHPLQAGEYVKWMDNIRGQSFGMDIKGNEHGDAMVTGFTNARPKAVGVIEGSVLVRINGIDIRGQGHEGVALALKGSVGQLQIAFVFRAPPGYNVTPPPRQQERGGGAGHRGDDAPIICTFDEERQLGLVFERRPHDEQQHAELLVLSSVLPDTQASKFPRLRPGLFVQAINGRDVEGMPMDATMNLMKARPATITFVSAPQEEGRQGGAHHGDHADDGTTSSPFRDPAALRATGDAEIALYGRTSLDDARSAAESRVPKTNNILSRVDEILARDSPSSTRQMILPGGAITGRPDAFSRELSFGSQTPRGAGRHPSSPRGVLRGEQQLSFAPPPLPADHPPSPPPGYRGPALYSPTPRAVGAPAGEGGLLAGSSSRSIGSSRGRGWGTLETGAEGFVGR